MASALLTRGLGPFGSPSLVLLHGLWYPPTTVVVPPVIVDTASGTYGFEPTIADFADEAFERAGVSLEDLGSQHLRSARRSLDFVFSDWASKQVFLWAVSEQADAVEDGEADYDVPTNTVAVLDMVYRKNGVDTPVFPMSRSEYMAIPDKNIEGRPTRYFFDRQRLQPTVTLWPVPDNDADEIVYFRMRKIQEAGAAAYSADVPERWYEPLASALAARLALKFKPERYPTLKAEAAEAFKTASREERERGDTHFCIA